MRFLSLTLVFLFLGVYAWTQPLRRSYLGAVAQSALQLEYYADSNQVLYGYVQANWAGEGRDRVSNTSWSRWEASLRYERWFSDHWAVGGRYTSTRISNERINEWEGYGLHSGHIGERWFLVKSLHLSRLLYGISDRDDDWKVAGMAYLGRRFSLGEQDFQLGLRYDLAKVWPTLGDARRVSETRLTLQADVPLGRHWMLGLFAQRHTQYFFGLAQQRYNADGELIESVPYHRLNRVNPIYGLRVRYLMQKSQARRALPWTF